MRIDTSVEVKYHVHYAASFEDLEVISEQVGDGEWDDQSPAICGQCGWRGAVGQLRCQP